MSTPERNETSTRGDSTPGFAPIARGDAWLAVDEARARASDLDRQAAAAHAEADLLEAKATAADEGVEHAHVDPLAGTWEGTVAPEAPVAAVSNKEVDSE